MLSSCCGFRLNTAGIVIGWLGATASFLGIVLLSITLGNLDYLIKNLPVDPNTDVDAIRHVALIVICVYLVFHAINLAASAMLILGTVKNRHLLLVPWLLNAGISMFFSCIVMLILLIGAFSNEAPIGMIASNLFFTGFGVALQFYIWFAIYSLYKQIQSESDLQQRLIAAPSRGSYPSYTKI